MRVRHMNGMDPWLATAPSQRVTSSTAARFATGLACLIATLTPIRAYAVDHAHPDQRVELGEGTQHRRQEMDGRRGHAGDGHAAAAAGGAPVAAAREGGAAGSFQLDVAAAAVHVHHLAQQDRPAVAQLRHEIAELVPGIGLGEGAGARGDRVAHCHLGRQRAGVDPQLPGQRPVHLDQHGGGNRGRVHPHMHGARQPGIGIVEGDRGVSFGHGLQYKSGGPKLPTRSNIKNSLCPHGQGSGPLL